jgi:hypothetical protein
MKTFLLRGDFGSPLGLFVAEDASEVLEMLARRHGYASVAEADAAEPRGSFPNNPRRWSERHRAWPVPPMTRTARSAKTDINAILDVVFLTDEDQGITGHLVRLGLYRIAGRITLDDVMTWVDHHMHGPAEEGEEGERRQLQSRMLPMVDQMRIDALENALRDVGLDNLGSDLSRARWRAVPDHVRRIQAALKQRRGATRDKGAQFYLRAAEKAAAEVLEGRKGVVVHVRGSDE